MMRIYLTLALLIGCLTASSQRDGFSVLAQAGPAVTQVGSSTTLNKEPLVTSRYGILGEAFFRPRTALTLGFFADEKGNIQTLVASDTSGTQVGQTTARTFLNFASLNAGVRHYMEDGQGIFFEVGFNASLLTSARYTVEATDLFSGVDSDVADNYSNFDVGLVLGIGYAKQFNGPARLTLGFQHHYGVLDLNTNSTVNERANTLLSTFVVGIGINLSGSEEQADASR